MGKKPGSLYKTTLTIWSQYRTEGLELEALGREADQGAALCSRSTCEEVAHPENDPEYPDTDFFRRPEQD